MNLGILKWGEHKNESVWRQHGEWQNCFPARMSAQNRFPFSDTMKHVCQTTVFLSARNSLVAPHCLPERVQTPSHTPFTRLFTICPTASALLSPECGAPLQDILLSFAPDACCPYHLECTLHTNIHIPCLADVFHALGLSLGASFSKKPYLTLKNWVGSPLLCYLAICSIFNLVDIGFTLRSWKGFPEGAR